MRRRREDPVCAITTTLYQEYRLERDYRQRHCLEAILAAIREAIQGVIRGAILGAILEFILGAILQVILEVTPDMGPVQLTETAILAIQVDHQADRIQYRDHCTPNLTIRLALSHHNLRHFLEGTNGVRTLDHRRKTKHRRAKDTKSRRTHTRQDNIHAMDPRMLHMHSATAD
jgi:hypothetical protein